MTQQAAPNQDQPASSDTTAPLVIPKELTKLVRQRLQRLVQVERLEHTRQQVRQNHAELPDAVDSELSRQSRELQRIPDSEKVDAMLQKLASHIEKEKKKNVAAQTPDEDPPDDELEDDDLDDDDDDDDLDDDDDDDQEDDEEGDEPDSKKDTAQDTQPQPSEDAPPAPEAVAEPTLIIEILELGCKQLGLLQERNALTDEMLQAAAACVAEEPLYKLLESHGCDPSPLYGWAVYSLALERFSEFTKEKLAAVRDTLSEAEQGRSRKADPDERELTLRDEVQLLTYLQSAERRELQSVQPVLVNAYWRVYEEAAVLLATGKAAAEHRVYLRALMRFGVIFQSPFLLPTETTKQLMSQCEQAVEDWGHAVDATCVLYPDEYIDLSARGVITSSIDEDLELNNRGSAQWTTDKMWRKIIYGRIAGSALGQVLSQLNEESDGVTQKIEKLEKKITKLDPGKASSKQKKEKLLEKIQDNKAKLARLKRSADLIEQKFLPNEAEIANGAQAKLDKLDESIQPASIARREAKGMRRHARLCAHLKEPFFPFVMRDKYNPTAGTGAVNDRETLLAEIAEIENRDPRVFKDILVHANKPANRVYIRHSPYILLIPTCGDRSMSLNPRSGTEVGRLAFPFLNIRPGALAKLIYQVIADFRYDTSKESAGVDLMTSDTLVAAYATVRWNYRKRGKEIREKAGIYNEEKDRENWQRHYELYITSATDGGKKLFFKCQELYEAVLKYMDLPDGVQKLA